MVTASPPRAFFQVHGDLCRKKI